MKRMIAILLAVLTTAALLTGCSGRNDGNVSTTPDGTVNGSNPTTTVPGHSSGTTGSDGSNVNPADQNDATGSNDTGSAMENFGNDMKDAANDMMDDVENAMEPDSKRSSTHRESGVGMQGGR